jgi:hypothetical protein
MVRPVQGQSERTILPRVQRQRPQPPRQQAPPAQTQRRQRAVAGLRAQEAREARRAQNPNITGRGQTERPQEPRYREHHIDLFA